MCALMAELFAAVGVSVHVSFYKQGSFKRDFLREMNLQAFVKDMMQIFFYVTLTWLQQTNKNVTTVVHLSQEMSLLLLRY